MTSTETTPTGTVETLMNDAAFTQEAMRAMGIEAKDAKTAMDAVTLAKAIYEGNFKIGMLSTLFNTVERAGNTEIAQKMMKWALTKKAENMAGRTAVQQAREQWIAMANDEKEAMLMSAIGWKGRLQMATMKSTMMQPTRGAINMKNWLQSQAGKVFDSAMVGPDQLMLDELWDGVLTGIFPVDGAMMQRVLGQYMETQNGINTVAELAQAGGTIAGQPEVSVPAELVQFGIKMDAMLLNKVLPDVRQRMADKFAVPDTLRTEHDAELRAAGQAPAEA